MAGSEFINLISEEYALEYAFWNSDIDSFGVYYVGSYRGVNIYEDSLFPFPFCKVLVCLRDGDSTVFDFRELLDNNVIGRQSEQVETIMELF